MALFLEVYTVANTVEPPAAGRPTSVHPLPTPRHASRDTPDGQIRAAGLALLGIAVASIRLLSVSIHAVPLHSATSLEFLAALIGVGSGCLGNILLWEGGHINDACEVSERWRRYR